MRVRVPPATSFQGTVVRRQYSDGPTGLSDCRSLAPDPWQGTAQGCRRSLQARRGRSVTGCLDLFAEVQKFCCSVTLVAFADDKSPMLGARFLTDLSLQCARDTDPQRRDRALIALSTASS